VNRSRFYLAKLSVENLVYQTGRAQGKDSIQELIERCGFNLVCVFCRGLPLQEHAQVLLFYYSLLVFSTKHYNERIFNFFKEFSVLWELQ
jgi:hypothetical protein